MWLFPENLDRENGLLFTEETGLADDDLRATAWKTYHVGFRWVRETSGQGLRPAWDREYGRPSPTARSLDQHDLFLCARRACRRARVLKLT